MAVGGGREWGIKPGPILINEQFTVPGPNGIPKGLKNSINIHLFLVIVSPLYGTGELNAFIPCYNNIPEFNW